MAYQRREEETVFSINQLRHEVEDNQMGIGITEEDGPINTMIAVFLGTPGDHEDWTAICRLHPETRQPSSYPAIAVWYTNAPRGNPYKVQEYMFFPLNQIPCIDNSRPAKQKATPCSRLIQTPA